MATAVGTTQPATVVPGTVVAQPAAGGLTRRMPTSTIPFESRQHTATLPRGNIEQSINSARLRFIAPRRRG